MRNTYLNHLDDANYPFASEVPWPKCLIRHMDVCVHNMESLDDVYVSSVLVVDGEVKDVVVSVEGSTYVGPSVDDRAVVVCFNGTPMPGLTETYSGVFRLAPGCVRVSQLEGFGGVHYRTKSNPQENQLSTSNGRLDLTIGGALTVETDPETGMVTGIVANPAFADTAFTKVYDTSDRDGSRFVTGINGVNVPLSENGSTLKVIIEESAIDGVPQLKGYLKSPTGESLSMRSAFDCTPLSEQNTYLGGNAIALCILGTTAFPNCYGSNDDATPPQPEGGNIP